MGNFASHLLTVKHVVITVCCPLVYLPPEDIGPFARDYRAKQPIIYVPSIRCDLYHRVVPTLLSPLCLVINHPSSSQTHKHTKQAFNKTKLTRRFFRLRRLKILICSRLGNKATLTFRRSTRWKQRGAAILSTPGPKFYFSSVNMEMLQPWPHHGVFFPFFPLFYHKIELKCICS